MAKTWDYTADLPGGMTHSVQVQTDNPNADFDVFVLDANGNVLAKDDGPEAGAECRFNTETDQQCVVRVELVKGQGSFSLSVASANTRQEAESRSRDEPASAASGQKANGGSRDEVTELSSTQIEELLEAHNRWRAKCDVPPLQWSDDLASYAQEWADQLAEQGMQMRHRSPNKYGENIYWAAGKESSAAEVVDSWGSEEQFYDYEQNNWWPRAGHFSQVIWKTTTHVGGGIVKQDGQEIWVCNYTPRGNWTGEKPY